MRHHGSYIPGGGNAPKQRSDWAILRSLGPYLWRYKWRVGVALSLVLAAKLATMGVPILLKHLVDSLQLKPGAAASMLVIPLGLIVAYGALRLSTSVLTELRELVMSKATQGVSRSLTLQTFSHLHALSMRFHLARQTGGMTRDIERGTRAVNSLLSFSLYNILPTLIELCLVMGYLLYTFDYRFALVTLCALVLYIVYTISVTEWRTQFRRNMNELDSQAHTKAIDALINYETVKYFNNENFEAQRYDKHLAAYEKAALQSQFSLSLLNSGQQLIIGVGLVIMLWLATEGVVAGRMTLGDLVMINAFMIQVYIPLNFLGMVYRELKQSLTDLDKMFTLLEQKQEVRDAPDAIPLVLSGAPEIEFDDVHFAYEPNRPLLQGISLRIPAGHTVAVVGESGSGKSTLARLLYRFYEVNSGHIRINGTDIRAYTQESVRKSIGIVPQDTVLFNDSVAYNIGYGRPDASQEEIETAAKAAHIHDFIQSTPKGYATAVGERGLKLSGGEKQRVAIARTLLKNPQVLIFDEATSALDSANERAIQAELRQAAQGKTTLIIAHRLSTIVHANSIVVMQHGRILEQGQHDALLQQNGAYARMWALQNKDNPGNNNPVQNSPVQNSPTPNGYNG